MLLVLQHIFASRETILGMEHHDQERRAADPDTWHLQKHLIVDFIQKVDIMKCIIISAANRLIGEVVQSRRRPLLGPSPG